MDSEILKLRQQAFQLATDFSAASVAAFTALNADAPADQLRPLVEEALTLGAEYGEALDRWLAARGGGAGDDAEELRRITRFKSLLDKEMGLIRQHPKLPR